MTPPLSAWELTGAPVPLPGGHRNTVLRVGDHVVKTTRRSEAAVAWLLPVMEALTAYGLAAPRPMRSGDGRLVVEGWTCEPFVDGVPCATVSLRPNWPRLPKSLGQRPGFAAAQALQFTPRGGDIDLTTMPPPLVRAVRAAWSALPRAAPCVVHGDLNRSNLIQTTKGIAVIDWDEARLDHPGFDHVALGQATSAEVRAAQAWEIACCWQLEPERARELARRFVRDARRPTKMRAPSC